MRIGLKEYNEWIKELADIHAALDKWYNFAVGFLGERKQLLQAKEGIEKLKKLISFLERFRDQAFTRETTSD